jgi:hypothetical protein
MKKFVTILIFICFSITTFSQSNNEPPEIYKLYKKEIDSLSNLTKKKVTGYGKESFKNIENFIIYYEEDNKIKDSVLHTRRFNVKYSGS